MESQLLKLTATARVPAESLELAQKAFDSGLTSVSGISKASGLSRNTVRRMLARVGRKIGEPNKSTDIWDIRRNHYAKRDPREARLAEVAGQIVRGEI